MSELNILPLKVLSVETLYKRYKRLAQSLPRCMRWFALVFAPAGISFIVFSAGLLNMAGALVVTAGIDHVTATREGVSYVTWLLILAFLVESLSCWVKDRYEMLLTVVVRQLTYRRFRQLFQTSASTAEAREHVLTYPGQISQFAYVVDFAVSTVQIIIFVIASLVLYGANGVIATLLIVALVIVSLRLINLIGRLWEQYVGFEGERRRWIQKVADSLPRGRYIPSWGTALDKISSIRSSEEKLLHARVRLQVLNGFLEKGALTTMLALVAIVAAWLWPNAGFGLGIILAARYLYAAVQNNVINYRVIRLALPMMRELDKLEKSSQNTVEDQTALEALGTCEVIPADSKRANKLREYVSVTGSAFVPRNPELSQAILSAWHTGASPRQVSLFAELAEAMGLNQEVVSRLWRDVKTLSSGERHRAAVAIVLADEPNWLILDDTFAALDPAMREIVAKKILASVPNCTLLASSEEYVPDALANRLSLTHRELSLGQLHAEQITSQELGSLEEVVDLPDPQTEKATFQRTLKLLFGPHIVWIGLGALLLSGSTVAFALTVAQNNLHFEIVGVSLGCILAAVLGSIIFFGALYRAPITRLTTLHERLVYRLDQFASPRTSGAVVGRLGEDFSDLQMSVPGAVGSVFLVWVQSALLIAGAVAGAPLFIVVVCAVAPLAWLVGRQGSKWILPASTACANARGEFIGVVSAQASAHTAPVSVGLRQAGERAYVDSETSYVASSIQLADAYALRSGLIQLLVLTLKISAVLLVSLSGGVGTLIAPAAVIYFALTLSSGLQSVVETLQEVGVVSLTAERVRMLEEFKTKRSQVPVRHGELEQLKSLIDSGCSLIALIGSTGAGKSVMLDALYRNYGEDKVTVIPEVDPLAVEVSDLSGLELARSVLEDGAWQLVLLDETLKGLNPVEERSEIESMKQVLCRTGKQAVVVLHSRSNLDCFETVVNIGERTRF